MTEFLDEIRSRVRKMLLSQLAQDVGTTSITRPGMILSQEAEDDRFEFFIKYGSGNCSCFISPPCNSCTHPGNPVNQEVTDECWIPILKE